MILNVVYFVLAVIGLIVSLLILVLMLRQRSRLYVKVSHEGATFFGVKYMHMTVDHRVLLTLVALTLTGKDARLDGEPEWISSDESVVSIEPVEGNPNQVWATARSEGTASISFSADADLDEGEVREIQGSLDFTITGAEAVLIELRAGSPELQPTT